MAAFVSVREYARRRGCSHVAVLNAIKDGRVTAVARTEAGKVLGVDPVAADQEWARNTDVDQAARAGASHVAPTGQGGGAGNAPEIPPKGGDSQGYLEARATKERFAALAAEREYLQAIGQLVPAGELREASVRRYRALRDKLLNIPDRVASILAAETDPARVHAALTAELKRVLHELSDDARAEAAGGAEERMAA